jgi:Right handed beta helix region
MYSQPGIFNVLDYGGMVPNNPLPLAAQANAATLQNAINYAQASGANPDGAIVLIPSYAGSVDDPEYGPYYIDTSELPNSTITIAPSSGGANMPLLVMGTGEGTTLIMENPSGAWLFSVSASFLTFQDLTIVNQVTSETADAIAFNFSSGENYKLFRVNIQNYPQVASIAFTPDSGNVTYTNLLQCNISYDSEYSGPDCVAITDSGAETNIEQCALTFGGSAGGILGINIVGSSFARVTDTQISGFQTGIQIGAGTETGIAKGSSFTGLDIEATGSCVSIVNHMYDACFVNCTFQPTDPASPPSEPAISIGISGDENNEHYDTIRFTACTVLDYGQYGLAISYGKNIQINGGMFSGNGTAGIAIIGPATQIQITGANCTGTSRSGATQHSGIYVTSGQDIQVVGANCSNNQTSGIQVAGSSAAIVSDLRILGCICTSSTMGIAISAASNVLIDGCTLTGNSSYAASLSAVQNVTIVACDVYSSSVGAQGIGVAGPGSPIATQYVFIRSCNAPQWGEFGSVDSTFLVVSGSVSNLEVTDCAGYNDQGAILLNQSHAPNGSFTGISVANYYGPTAFYVDSTASTAVTIDGQATYLDVGSFTLAPGETAEIANHTETTHFLMVGK